MLAIVDYGVGNLFSLKSSLAHIGVEACVTGDADTLRRAQRIILPGVGAFGDAAEKLRESGLASVVVQEAERGKPLLGICLGMQLLFEKGFEYGEHAGLGLLPGAVRPIAPIIGAGLKVPHIGWNALSFPESKTKSPLFAQVDAGECVYFVHSFMANTTPEYIAADTDYGVRIPALVQNKMVFGAQFHPEKSGETGLKILRNFGGLTR